HGRRAGRARAQAAEIEEPAQRVRGRLAEQVVEDRLRRAERLMGDARRVPDEEGLHAELGGTRIRHAIEQGVEEAEQVTQVEDGLGIVRRLRVAAAARRRSRSAGEAVRASEDALPGAGAGVEAVVADRSRELAAEERAVAAHLVAGIVRVVGQGGVLVERAQRRRDGAEDGRRLALAFHALLVAAGEDARERREAPRRGVVGYWEDRAVAREQV